MMKVYSENALGCQQWLSAMPFMAFMAFNAFHTTSMKHGWALALYIGQLSYDAIMSCHVTCTCYDIILLCGTKYVAISEKAHVRIDT